MKCEKKRMPKIMFGISIIIMIAIGAMFFLNLISSIIVLSSGNVLVNGFEITAILLSNVLLPVCLLVVYTFGMNIDNIESIGKRRYFVSTEELGEKAVDTGWKVAMTAVFTFFFWAVTLVLNKTMFRYPDVFPGKVVLRNISVIMWIVMLVVSITTFVYYRVAYNKLFHKELENITNWTLFLVDVDYAAEKYAEKVNFDEKAVEGYRKDIMNDIKLNYDFEKYKDDEAMIETYAMHKAINFCKDKK